MLDILKSEVFKKDLKRNKLLALSKNLHLNNPKKIIINIYRNHSIEPILSVINPFLCYCNIEAQYNIGSYDDSLSFDNIKQADLELVFIDFANYKQANSDYIIERLRYLREHSKAHILVLLVGLDTKKYKNEIPNCFIFHIEDLLQELDIFDLAKFEITATRLSNNACLRLAQILGLSIIPSLFLPNLKAIIIDLDNTLYSGILGEDGIENIILSKEHKALQEKILSYKKQGYLLAIASKNEEIDVKKLFELRDDFILKWSDFDCHKINWNDKAKSLVEIAKTFNIGLDSLLFIDDNIAEIESISPLQIKNILATSPSEVLRILEIFPQLRKLQISKEDSLRSIDIEANTKRETLKELSPKDYFSQLEINLDFSRDNLDHALRIHQLLNKTNQFISNYTRPSQIQVQEWLEKDEYCIITISMKDKLSDSGIIGIVVGKYKDKQCVIYDIVISCRALGRKLESIMLYYAFYLIADIFTKRFNIVEKNLILYYKKGERNSPFLQTLQQLSTNIKEDSALITITKPDIQGLSISIQG